MIKLSILLVLINFCEVQAKVYGQGSITVEMKQSEISTILNRIEKNSEFRFLYNYDLKELKKKTDLNVTQSSLQETLNKLFQSTHLTYKILDNNLVIILSGVGKEQDITVSGKVTGPNGESLSGVTVLLKGTSVGTNTDANGQFSLTVPDNGTLVISYIGYTPQEIRVDGRQTVNIQLSGSTAKMDEVVVVGYGSQRRGDVTGAVSVVSAADIANRPIINAGEALQGKAAGVQVISNSGKPGAGFTIRVRGASSISAGNDPLYVVDGIPMTDITAINPGDIESMTVLKDAASASIYGTRAANGVVVITTKKGVAGKSRIDFGYYYGSTSTTKKLDVLNASQYQEYMNESYDPDPISDSLVQANNVNWPDEVFRKGSQANYQVSVSGGNEKTQHFISLNYNDQVGMIRPAVFNRLTGRVNLNSKITDRFSISSSTIVSRANQKGVTDNSSVARGGVVLSALATPPTVGKYNALGQIAQNPLTGWENPLGAIDGQKNRTTTDRIISNLGGDFTVIKGLILKSRFGIDYQNLLDNTFIDPFLTQDGRNRLGNIAETKSTQFVWLSEQTINYSTAIGKSHLTALAGWTAQNSRFDQTNISGSNINPENRFKSFNEIYMRAATKAPATKNIDEWALISYLGRIIYDFDGKYLLQANIRSDKSSKFAPENRTATFPSFSAGWRISEENFFKDIKVFDELKIRAGWGQNGNQEGIGSYQYLSLSNIDPQNGSTSPASIAPSDLRWETSTQTNIGIDASMLGKRITFTADFYVKKTENVLVNIPLPSQAGFTSVLVNMGSMRNVGEEFVISSRNIVNGPLLWNTDFNISFNKNEVLSIGNGISFMNGYGNIYDRGNSVALVQGYGLGTFYGYVAEGVNPQTGMQLYKTVKGPAPYIGTAPSDREIIGSAQPKFVYGMTNSLSYKNFDFTVFVQGSQGNKIFNGVRVETEGMKDSRNQSTAVLDRWRKPGDQTNIPGVSPASNDNSQISTRFIEDGSYLRFKTITLSYKIGDRLLKSIGMGSAAVYVSAQNLITITKYTGFDPEVNTYGTAQDTDNRNISLGVDYGAYPQPKILLVGVNVGFK